MTRRTFEQIFMDKLAYMAGDPPATVSSRAVRDALGWQDERFASVRRGLVDAGMIKGVAGGPGGSILMLPLAKKITKSRAKKEKSPAISAFISYSHADSKIKNDLLKHLSPLRRLGLISDWHDGEIKPGDEWQKSILKNLNSARIILLLISSDFIASEFCYVKELARAMERHQANEAVVLPVIVRSCIWHELPFGKLQALPDQGRAITTSPDIDEALTQVALGVQTAAQTLIKAN